MPKNPITRLTRTTGGKVAVISLSAAVVASGALFVLTSGNDIPDYTLSGSTLSNAEELLSQAEARHADFIASQHEVQVKSVDGDSSLCFLVSTGDELTDKIACGLALHPSQDVGGYDTIKVTYSRTSETAITGEVDGDFQAGGEVLAGSVLTRPDGKAPLPGDALLRPVDAAVPLPEALIPAEGHGVIQERVEVLTEVVEKPVYVRVPGKSIEVTSAAARDVKTSDEAEYRTERGTEVITVQADIREDAEVDTGNIQPTYTLIITTPEGEQRTPVTPEQLEDGFEALVPSDAKVELGVEFDGIEQRLNLREGSITSDQEDTTDLLYNTAPRVAALNPDDFWIRAEDATITGDIQQVSLKPYLADAQGNGTWAQEGGFVEVVVTDLDNMCTLLANASTEAEQPYSFDNVRLRLDGTDIGAPDVVVPDTLDGNAYRLAWDAPADVETVELNPNITVQCEGTPMMSDTFISYSATATEEAAGWFSGEFIDLVEEGEDAATEY